MNTSRTAPKDQVLKTSFPIVAAFDFDGTLTYRDTLLPFLFFVAGPLQGICKLVVQLPRIALSLIKKESRQTIKEGVLKRFLGKMPKDEALLLGQQFAFKHVCKHLNPEAIERLHWHQKQGHRCILISANLNIYLHPWGKQAGFHDIITSVCEEDQNGVLTGRLVGLNCWGPEKVRRLLEVLGPHHDYTLYAYGDSLGDKELLASADYSFYRKLT
jgi:phosphatidylglycerophosphatase C